MDRETLRDRFEGCLLGGAAGDALGYAIEFSGEKEIFSRFGPSGIQTLGQATQRDHGEVAHFSDDTQMTLFTAAGLMHGMDMRGGAPEASDIWLAYREWLGTQGDSSRMDDPASPRIGLSSVRALHALRAPGNTCLSAIRTSPDGGTPEDPVNDSKGCGGVMRVAPIGLLAGAFAEVDPARGGRQASALAEVDSASGGRQASAFAEVDPYGLGAQAAALTHGHPMGWLPAAALAGIVALLCRSEDEEGQTSRETLVTCIRDAADTIARRFSDWGEARELRDATYRAIDLALEHGGTNDLVLEHGGTGDLACIHELGEGWVGDEALLIAVYAVVAHADDVSAALACAANHRGDSDSTAAIAGNILGSLVGRDALERSFDLTPLEERALIASVADDLLDHALAGGKDASSSHLRFYTI